MLKKFNEGYISFIQKKYWLALGFYLILTLFLGYRATKIDINTRFIDLLPEDKESVINLKKVVDYYGGEGYLIGVIEWNYAYGETLNTLTDLQKETDLLVKEMKLLVAGERPDADKSASLSDWVENRSGIGRLEKLKEFYETKVEEIKIQLEESMKDKYSEFSEIKIDSSEVLKEQVKKHPKEKYLIFLQYEMETTILPELEKLSLKLKENPKSVDAGFEVYNSLVQNHSAFTLYYNTIVEKEGGEKYLTEAAEKLSEGLLKKKAVIETGKEAEPIVTYSEYKFSSNFIKDRLLFFIDVPDLQDIRDRIKKKIDYERRGKVLSSAIFVDEKVTLDFDDIQDKYEKSTKVVKIDSKTDLFEKSEKPYDYYINKEKNRLLILIKPSKESTDIGFAQLLFDAATEVANDVKKSFPEELTIGYTGRYVKKIDDAKIIKRDLKIITPMAIGIILLSVIVYFRKFRAFFVVGLPLASGLVWATGVVELSIGYFNIVTGFLIAILSGLGVDFGVNLFSRYIEERKRGREISEALTITFNTTFLSNLTATATTAAAFFILVISDFKGFSQFGYTAGLGMLLMLLGILFAFPAIIIISEKISPIKPKAEGKSDEKRGKKLPYHRIIIYSALAFTVFSVFSIFKTQFNANFYDLAADNTLVKKLEKKAEELIKMSLWPVIIYAEDKKTMEDISREINALQSKNELFSLDKLDSLSNYVPENQKEKKAVMLEIKNLLRDSVLTKLKGDEKKKVERLRDIVDAPFIEEKDVPVELSQQFFGKKPGYFIFYYPRHDLSMSNPETIKIMVDDLNKFADKFKDKKLMISSDAMVFNDILKLINFEGPIIVILVLFVIGFLLWLDFRSIKDVLTSLFPLTIGIVWIFGWTYIMGWSFNYFNIVMFPVIMGLGIDYGVHFLHRYKEEKRTDIFFVVVTTGLAIFIGGLTDILGFGTLIFAKYKGLATMGQISIVGIISCVFVGVLFMGSILQMKKNIGEMGWKKALFGRNKN